MIWVNGEIELRMIGSQIYPAVIANFLSAAGDEIKPTQQPDRDYSLG
jgi:hypothetical protein